MLLRVVSPQFGLPLMFVEPYKRVLFDLLAHDGWLHHFACIQIFSDPVVLVDGKTWRQQRYSSQTSAVELAQYRRVNAERPRRLRVSANLFPATLCRQDEVTRIEVPIPLWAIVFFERLDGCLNMFCVACVWRRQRILQSLSNLLKTAQATTPAHMMRSACRGTATVSHYAHSQQTQVSRVFSSCPEDTAETSRKRWKKGEPQHTG